MKLYFLTIEVFGLLLNYGVIGFVCFMGFVKGGKCFIVERKLLLSSIKPILTLSILTICEFSMWNFKAAKNSLLFFCLNKKRQILR